MPPKQKIPAPIDRPLSRAYLREFTGWSTAFPPGLSEPTSLRVMENMMTNRDGSLRIRPGLRYLTYGKPIWIDSNLNGVVDPDDEYSRRGAMDYEAGLVGTHEVFFLNDGSKAYLFAIRDKVTRKIKFRVARSTGEGISGEPFEVVNLNDPRVLGREVPPDEELLELSAQTTYVKYLQIDNKIVILSNADTAKIFYAGAEKKVVSPKSIGVPEWSSDEKPKVRQPTKESIDDPVALPPWNNQVTPAMRTAKTLLPPVADYDSIPYSIGYFYTFSNEFGESAASQINVIKPRRRWTAWRWQTANITHEPSGTETDNPKKVADQLAIYPTSAAFTAAKDAGATHFNVYAIMWSDQDPVPVEGHLVGSLELADVTDHLHCWVRHSPDPFNESRTVPLPTKGNRRNYSKPPKAAQGLVAMDRMILVNDPSEGAVIRWSSNRAGEYLNLTAFRGGGYKTLTSGNLYIPVSVKLWQNPESKDTLTILCLGIDGYSQSFYMAPAEVSAQTDATQIMGFEETTGTPGTVSPWAVEVLNNTLYQPLEDMLMKTTASNYNINHKTMTELIQDKWIDLVNKKKMVSSQLDNRLYYLVHNPEGEELKDGCWGNEVWVLDTAAEQGTWSRWTVQGHSLRKIEVAGQVVMSIVRPDGIYCFDERATDDEFVIDGVVAKKPIRWKIETNTQGANRAHDAWAHLQQVSLTLGNFTGSVRYGIRSYDVNGKPVEVAKVAKDLGPKPTDGLMWDLTDSLLVRRDLMEWRFFAESYVTVDGTPPLQKTTVHPSSGMLNLVQYRYTPVSVNVGYEHGSIETLEYGRDVVGSPTNTINGVPVPMTDTRRP